MKIVIFDFDKTLTKKDTLMPFANYISKKRGQIIKFYIFLFYYFLFKLRIISNKVLKEIFLKEFFDGYAIEELKEFIQDFEKCFIKKNLNKDIFNKFSEYIKNGYKVIVLSSNLEIILKNLSMLKDATILGTVVNYNKLNSTYRIKGNVCRESEKIRRLKVLFGDEIFEKAIFYGDKEDKFLLKIFKKSIKV